MTTPVGTPMVTTVNGQPAPWSDKIWSLWYTFADAADPKWRDVTVSTANYFTPRPYVDEYNTGSDKHGFVYTLLPGHRVCLIELAREWR